MMKQILLTLLLIITLSSISAQNGKYIGQIKAYDPDGGKLSFLVVDGNTGRAFAIDKVTGSIKIYSQKAINNCKCDKYEIKVKVSDDGMIRNIDGTIREDVIMSKTVLITIRITDGVGSGVIKTHYRYNKKAEVESLIWI